MGVTPTCQLPFSVVRVKRLLRLRLLANDRTSNIIANDYSSAPFASNRTARKTIDFPPSLGAYVLTRWNASSDGIPWTVQTAWYSMLVLAHTLPTLKFRLTACWKMRDNDNIFSPGDSYSSCVSPLRPRWLKRILADFFKYHTSWIVNRPLFVYSHTIHRLRSSNNSNSQSLPTRYSSTFFHPFNFVRNMKKYGKLYVGSNSICPGTTDTSNIIADTVNC